MVDDGVFRWLIELVAGRSAFLGLVVVVGSGIGKLQTTQTILNDFIPDCILGLEMEGQPAYLARGRLYLICASILLPLLGRAFWTAQWHSVPLLVVGHRANQCGNSKDILQ